MLERSDPALKRTTFLAAILISLPVCGLRPVLAALLETEKDPNPTREILSPFLNAQVVYFTNQSNALLASDFDNPASDAIASINSALLIVLVFSLFKHYVNGNKYIGISLPYKRLRRKRAYFVNN